VPAKNCENALADSLVTFGWDVEAWTSAAIAQKSKTAVWARRVSLHGFEHGDGAGWLPAIFVAKRLECAVFRRFMRQYGLCRSKAPEFGALQTLRESAWDFAMT
jgi:hypothetical protein